MPTCASSACAVTTGRPVRSGITKPSGVLSLGAATSRSMLGRAIPCASAGGSWASTVPSPASPPPPPPPPPPHPRSRRGRLRKNVSRGHVSRVVAVVHVQVQPQPRGLAARLRHGHPLERRHLHLRAVNGEVHSADSRQQIGRAHV